jgi:hypothetical protein
VRSRRSGRREGKFSEAEEKYRRAKTNLAADVTRAGTHAPARTARLCVRQPRTPFQRPNASLLARATPASQRARARHAHAAHGGAAPFAPRTTRSHARAHAHVCA